jgi:hypothetical protein
LDLIIWRHSGVECGGRGEKRETHGERRESEARRRVAARAAAAGRNRFDELTPSPCRNGVDAVAAIGHLSTVGRAAALNLTGAEAD